MSDALDKNPTRTLLVLAAAGSTIFVSLLFILQTSLTLAGTRLDSSLTNFYPMMAGLGALFGFERWWAYEQGPYNPFHDSSP